MPVTVLERIKTWLSTCPCWKDAWHIELTEDKWEETGRQADLVGNSQIGCRCEMSLRWQMPGLGNDLADACRLMDFQQWVSCQSGTGGAPQLGDMPGRERIYAEKGGFTPGAQVVTYTVKVVADFVKICNAQ